MSLLTALALASVISEPDCTPIIVHSAPKSHVIS